MKRIVGVVFYDGRIGVEEEEMPELVDNQVLVEVHSSLISPGTEMALARNLRKKHEAADSSPHKFGYSNAGIILETKGDVKGLKPGMRVACMGGGGAL
ncbi:MAG: hypothetical protein J6X55_03960, partial [Victivallales bacterium]|nr:hypothetical protein [Victivallales bacterium]